MIGREFISKIRALARKRELEFRFEHKRGKGSHGTLYLGDKKTIVKDRKKEIGVGLLAHMLEQLGLSQKDIHED